MNRNFSIAPCSWGIEDPFNPDNPGWMKVLDDAEKSGFQGIELGPYGYLPTDPPLLLQELSSRSLRLIAGTLYANLSVSANLTELKALTRKIGKLISSVAGTDQVYLVIIDAVSEQRNATAGHPETAQRLDSTAWTRMIRTIEMIAAIAVNEYGVIPVVHPHAGGYIEFGDEIERFLNDTSQKNTGLCLDTGHLFYAGDDPVNSLRRFAERLTYVHFKDINLPVYESAIAGQMGFFDACRAGVMCPIGQGCIDYSSIFNVLDAIKYTGWITIEQERDPKEHGKTLGDLQESCNYLNSL